ncbi:MAG: BCCT family transporter [Myxococcota bacterium]
MEPLVFLGAAAVVVGFVLFGTLFTATAKEVFEGVQAFIATTLGWLYVLTTSLLVGFAIWLMFSRFGHVRLGKDDDRPEFGRVAWFTMLFSAGMGTGLVFWSVAEPLRHYIRPPRGEGGTAEAVQEAMRLAFFHWGLHPWAIYIVLGVALAYHHFRHDLPLAPRSVLHPLLGDRIYGPIGHGVDILATAGTLFGVATSLGLGAMQVNAGLQRSMGLPHGTMIQVIIIATITAVATISVVLGVHKGIRRLSELNMILAAVLIVFVLVAGPTLFQIELFVTSVGRYAQELVATSLWLDPRPDADWQKNWTLFYWGWWIAWAPFVGVFVARISRGRTVRDFVVSVFVVPTLVTFAWFGVFGGTGLYLERFTDAALASAVRGTPSIALHAMLEHLPLADLTTAMATALIVVFFITSSDSGSLVVDMVTSGGHPNPPVAQRVFWALSEGAVAATLLVAGGLQALRAASIASGLPMMLLLGAAAVGLVKRLRREPSGRPGENRNR